MKLIETLRTFKTRILTKFQDGDIRTKSLLSLVVVSSIALGIWFLGPAISWEDFHPLADPQKRVYIIASLYLLLLLKYLLVDLDTPTPTQFNDPATRKSVSLLQKRFYGALRFLRKTKIQRQGKSIRLIQLPWFLLIGPSHAGKTTLLSKSNINFILQRQFQHQRDEEIKASDHCDWWVTRDISIIDVPSRYFTETSQANATPLLWDYYLRIVKDQRGKDAFNGIIFALPLPEIMKQANDKAYHAMVRNLFRRLHEFKKHFDEQIPCYFLITKCDLLPGFAEFFAEAGNDEVTQAWGILMPPASSKEKLIDSFSARMNALIKKLNQQLLWRLHQERNPMARPYIKDFPLQVERMKECLLDFMKKFADEEFNLYVKGVYLSSSLQEKPDADVTILEESANTTQRSLQIFKEPHPQSRAFFITQFLTRALSGQSFAGTNRVGLGVWKRRLAYAASIFVIATVTIILGKDFSVGLEHTRTVQANFKQYSIALKQFQNPAEHLKQTVALMNELRQSAKDSRLEFSLESLMSYYSQKSQQKSYQIYKQALQDVYLTEIKNYLGEFIKTPINKNTDSVYTVLKAYLMLGNVSRMDTTYLKETLQDIFPSSYTKQNVDEIFTHLDTALSLSTKPLLLDATLIEKTRRYLLSLQGVPLAYIILKNINNNQASNSINLGIDNNAFTSSHDHDAIPAMFTLNGFTTAFSQDTQTAAQEALMGNWVLGDNVTISRTQEDIAALTDKLRQAYINDYIKTWEGMLSSIQLNPTSDLQQTDAIILSLISDNSPLLTLLQTLHENTYFDPITKSSERLNKLGLLVDNSNAPQNLLYQILVGLQALHQYIQPAIVTDNQQQKAFELVSKRMSEKGAENAITKVRLIAQKSPEPIKSWLQTITDNAWQHLMKDAIKYIDISWKNDVSRVYQADIANHYPFSNKQDKDVDMDKFIKFFGNPGVMVSFFNHYLKPFVNISGGEWRWKEIDGTKLPISNEALLQIRQGLKIHQAFFPKNGSNPDVRFTIEPYTLDKTIQSVKLRINNKQILSGNTKSKSPITLNWPISSKKRLTTLQLALKGKKPVNQTFDGDWGWFKLLSKSFDSAVSHKKIVLNFSEGKTPAKYTVLTSDTFNPFMSMNLKNFHLPQKLVTKS